MLRSSAGTFQADFNKDLVNLQKTVNLSGNDSSSIVDATSKLPIPKYVRLAPDKCLEFNKNFFATYGSVEQGALVIGICKPSLENLLKGKIVRRSTILKVLTSFGVVAAADKLKYIDFGDKTEAAQPQPITETPTDLRTASYDQVVEHLAAWKQQGKIVIFTEHLTGICISISDALTPKIFKGDPKKALINQSYIRVWQASKSMDEYSRLIDHVERDGFAPGYVHHLVRPDGVLEEFSTDFYLTQWMGKLTRIGVTDPVNRVPGKQIMTAEQAIAAYPALRTAS